MNLLFMNITRSSCIHLMNILYINLMNIPTNMKKNELFFFLNNESPFPNSELDDAAGQKKKKQFQICIRPSRRSLQFSNCKMQNT